MPSLEAVLEKLEGEALEAGSSVILTFSVDGGPKHRSDPVTLTGEATLLRSRVSMSSIASFKQMSVEAHSIVGENRTRVIGKGILNLAGGVLPRMSGGREAAEDVVLKGVKGQAGQVLSVRLKLVEGVVDDEGGEGGRGGVTKERIRLAMKRAEERGRIRAAVEGSLTRGYDPKRRKGERPMDVGAVRGFNLPEGASRPGSKIGSCLRINSGSSGAVSRRMEGSRHPAIAQSLEVSAAGSLNLTLEDPGLEGRTLGKGGTYAKGSLPLSGLKIGNSYLADLVLDEQGTRVLTTLRLGETKQEMCDMFSSDDGLQMLQVDVGSFVDLPLVMRVRLCSKQEDIVSDWVDSDEHDGELEAITIRVTPDGEEDEEAFASLREQDEENESDGVNQQLILQAAQGAVVADAPPQKGCHFTGYKLGDYMLLVEVYTPETPERDEESGTEGDSDTPTLVYLAACMVDLSEVAAKRETTVKTDPRMVGLAASKMPVIKYREMSDGVELRVSEDAGEALEPLGIRSFPRDLPLTIRLWESSTLSSLLTSEVDTEVGRVNGFDTWLAQLKVVTVDEAMMRDALEAIKLQAYLLQPLQSDGIFPEVDRKTFTNVDGADKLAASRSIPTTPVLPRVRDAVRRPRSSHVIRRLVRPVVPTRPVTPLTYTQDEVDKLVERARTETRERMQHRMDIERGRMMDRIDVVGNSLGEAVEEKRRFQSELDERSEALRKCGVEIMELRRQVKQQQADKAQIQRLLNEREAQHEMMTKVDDDLEVLDRGDLEDRLKLLGASYKDERARGAELLLKMQRMHAELTRMEELGRAHKSLQEAHRVMAGKMQEVQERSKKLGKYVNTVQQQEKVIEQLENMMEKALSDARESKGLRDERDAVKKALRDATSELNALRAQVGGEGTAAAAAAAAELGQLKSKVSSLESELEVAKNQKPKTPAADPAQIKALGSQIQQLQDDKEDLEKRLRQRPKPEGGGGADSEKERLMLLMRAERAEARIKAVENQLQTNSKKFAKEISGLKMKVMEKDAALSKLQG